MRLTGVFEEVFADDGGADEDLGVHRDMLAARTALEDESAIKGWTERLDHFDEDSSGLLRKPLK